MAKYTLRELYDLDNRSKIKADIENILKKEETFASGQLEELFGISGRAAQFVIKAVVVIVARSASPNDVEKLLQHLESYSWSQFGYYIVSNGISKSKAADLIYDQAFTMAGVLLGKC